MKVHINETPAIAADWIDECVLAKTDDTFYKVAVTFFMLSFSNQFSEAVGKAASVFADEDGYINSDVLCDNLTKALNAAGGSTVIPLERFFDNKMLKNITLTVDTNDVSVLRNLMNKRGK